LNARETRSFIANPKNLKPLDNKPRVKSAEEKKAPVAKESAAAEKPKAPEAKAKDPLAESVAHLNQLIMGNKELQIITKSFKAYRGDEKPETLVPGLTTQKLDEILRDALELKEGQPTPRSLRDLAKLSVESKWEPKDLLADLTGIAGSIKISLEELQETATVANTDQEKAA